MRYAPSKSHRLVAELWRHAEKGDAAHVTCFELHLDTDTGRYFIVENTTYSGSELTGKLHLTHSLDEYRAQHPRRWPQVQAIVTGEGR